MMSPDPQPNVISNPLFTYWGNREKDYDTTLISEGYASAFKEDSSTLLVSFEFKDADAKPFAAPLAEESGTSFLTILTDRQGRRLPVIMRRGWRWRLKSWVLKQRL